MYKMWGILEMLDNEHVPEILAFQGSETGFMNLNALNLISNLSY